MFDNILSISPILELASSNASTAGSISASCKSPSIKTLKEHPGFKPEVPIRVKDKRKRRPRRSRLSIYGGQFDTVHDDFYQ